MMVIVAVIIPPGARKVFAGKIFDVYQWKQTLFDGSQATFEAIDRPDTVHTVGVLPDGRILLTYDEQPHRGGVITPAGGRVEAGESPANAARREFREETGYEIGTLVPWHTYEVGIKMDWKVYAFIGRNLQKVSEPQSAAGERITLRTYTFDEFLELGRERLVRDKTLRIILLEALLDTRKRHELHHLLYEREGKKER